MKTADVIARLAQLRLVPVIILENAADAKPLAEALLAGGLPCAEVTFRTAAALEAISVMAQVPGLLVGAGAPGRRMRRAGVQRRSWQEELLWPAGGQPSCSSIFRKLFISLVLCR